MYAILEAYAYNIDRIMSSSQQAYTSLPPTSQLAGSVPVSSLSLSLSLSCIV